MGSEGHTRTQQSAPENSPAGRAEHVARSDLKAAGHSVRECRDLCRHGSAERVVIDYEKNNDVVVLVVAGLSCVIALRWCSRVQLTVESVGYLFELAELGWDLAGERVFAEVKVIRHLDELAELSR